MAAKAARFPADRDIAGCFGLGIDHRRFASDVVEAHLPVLLTPRVFTCSQSSPGPYRVSTQERVSRTTYKIYHWPILKDAFSSRTYRRILTNAVPQRQGNAKGWNGENKGRS